MKAYIVTSFIPGAKINHNFYNSLKTMSKEWNIPIKYIQTGVNYVKDIKGYTLLDELNDEYMLELITKEEYDIEREKLEDKYILNKEDEELLRKSVRSNEYLTENLLILDAKLNPNLLDPVSGLDSLVAMKGNIILGYPRQRFKTVPRSLRHHSTPRGIWCTGTISDPYYKDTKSGKKVENYHICGALLVMIENDSTFHIRQLQSNPDNSFYDLLYRYYPDGTVIKNDNIAGLVIGDIHPMFHEMGVMKSRLKLMQQLKPKMVFYHDALDCGTISHHNINKYITNALLREKFPDFKSEVSHAANLLQEYCRTLPNSEHYFVASNHPEHLIRWLEEKRYFDDPNNEVFGTELAYEYTKFKRGLVDYNIFEYAFRRFQPLVNMTFLERKDSIICSGIECNIHGDAGSNGAKGNDKSIGILFNGNSTSGHSHQPVISVFNNFVSGTASELSMSYTDDSGGSSWMHTDVIHYDSGTRSHIHYIPKER